MTAVAAPVDLAAPDVAGTIEAWRVWRLCRDGNRRLLASAVKAARWVPREPLVAECLRPRSPLDLVRRRKRHEAPRARCECGIYATELLRTREYGDWLSRTGTVVYGSVSLWGTVIECERGFRASHAYPTHLYVAADRRVRQADLEAIVRDLAAYSVPVDALAPDASDPVAFLSARRT